MRNLAAYLVAAATAMPFGGELAAQPAEVDPVDIEEWTVPYPDSRPRDPDAVSAEEVWFVGQRDDYLARLDPKTGEFVRRDLEDGAGPHNLIVGSDGIVWYAGNRKAYIGRYDPVSGEIEQIAMPDADARDPHTLIFDAGEEHIFFTVQGGNFVGRLTLASRQVDLVRVPTPRARPYGIDIAPDGTVWVVLFGTNKLAEINPDTLELTEHVLPDEGARPRRVGVLDNGHVYYTDYARGYLGRFEPSSGAFKEWEMPSGSGARPYGMAVDSQNRIWYVSTGPSPNPFVGFDPATGRFFSITHIPSGGGAVRHMDYHAPSGTVWFGADTNTIGRAKVEGE